MTDLAAFQIRVANIKKAISEEHRSLYKSEKTGLQQSQFTPCPAWQDHQGLSILLQKLKEIYLYDTSVISAIVIMTPVKPAWQFRKEKLPPYI